MLGPCRMPLRRIWEGFLPRATRPHLRCWFWHSSSHKPRHRIEDEFQRDRGVSALRNGEIVPIIIWPATTRSSNILSTFRLLWNVISRYLYLVTIGTRCPLKTHHSGARFNLCLLLTMTITLHLWIPADISLSCIH